MTDAMTTFKEHWYAGDKVKLTGEGWRDGFAGLSRGDIVTLVQAKRTGIWTIAEGDHRANNGPIWVHAYAEDYFAAELVEKSSPHRPAELNASTGWATTNTPGLEYPLAESSSGEVRTTSSTGGQKGVKPEAYALIPWEAMDEVARVYNAGAEKYAAHNWRKGYEWSKSFSAACRHLFAFWRGEDRDPELGTLHLANAAFHILGMITFALDREKYGEHDDRYTQAAPDSDS